MDYRLHREDEAAIQLADGTRFLNQVRAACRGCPTAREAGNGASEPVKPRKRAVRAKKAGPDAGGKVRLNPHVTLDMSNSGDVVPGNVMECSVIGALPTATEMH